jgi:18S rRNA (guanine1575-N7)-methyltransferase
LFIQGDKTPADVASTDGARAVLQLYPSGPEQAELITSSALRVGFSGGLVVDFPNSTRAKKYFLVLMAGPSDGALPRHADGDEGGEVRDGNACAMP